jgi:hypothetical protein
MLQKIILCLAHRQRWKDRHVADQDAAEKSQIEATARRICALSFGSLDAVGKYTVDLRGPLSRAKRLELSWTSQLAPALKAGKRMGTKTPLPYVVVGLPWARMAWRDKFGGAYPGQHWRIALASLCRGPSRLANRCSSYYLTEIGDWLK